MAKVTPRHVVCVLGKWRKWDAVEAVVREIGGEEFELDREFSLLEPDTRMVEAFEASYDRFRPTMAESDWQAIRNHTAVAYVLSPPLPKSKALELSGRMLRLTAALLQNGGTAAKGESAGIAHGRAHWLAMAAAHAQAEQAGDNHAGASKLFFAWVRRPLLSEDDEGVLYSCGMHLLGVRDVEIDAALDVETAVEWIDLLGLYLVADRPSRPLKDGEGFRLSDNGPRRLLRQQPCERYESEEFFYNPYGYYRLEAPEG
jgi:hypothetical protein